MQDGSTARPGFAICDAPSVRLLKSPAPGLDPDAKSAFSTGNRGLAACQSSPTSLILQIPRGPACRGLNFKGGAKPDFSMDLDHQR